MAFFKSPGAGCGGTACNPSPWGIDQEFKIILSYVKNLQQPGRMKPRLTKDKTKEKSTLE